MRGSGRAAASSSEEGGGRRGSVRVGKQSSSSQAAGAGQNWIHCHHTSKRSTTYSYVV